MVHSFKKSFKKNPSLQHHLVTNDLHSLCLDINVTFQTLSIVIIKLYSQWKVLIYLFLKVINIKGSAPIKVKDLDQYFHWLSFTFTMFTRLPLLFTNFHNKLTTWPTKMQTCNTNLKPEDCLIKIKCVCVFFENIGFPPQRFLLTPSPLTVAWWRRYGWWWWCWWRWWRLPWWWICNPYICEARATFLSFPMTLQ